jgi:integrase
LCDRFFNYLKARRWYRGENPAHAELHLKRKPRRRFKTTERRTTPGEDLVLRREGAKARIWPVILLTRWAGMRRGEACLVRWGEINLAEGYADVVGHEGGRKHPRRVWLAEWVVNELRALRPTWLPEDGKWPVWPGHPDTATQEFGEFCAKHLSRRITFNDLRASFSTDCYECGMKPAQESRIVGHGVAVAEKHYLDYEAAEARHLLPGDPLQGTDDDEPRRTGVPLRIA